MNPACSLARDLTEAKGLMRTSAPGRFFWRSSRAMPVPMDLPMMMMCCYLNPSLLRMY